MITLNIFLIGGVPMSDAMHVGSPSGFFTLIMLGFGLLFAYSANKYLDKKKKRNNPE